ncbi:N/A [soil metagenome]
MAQHVEVQITIEGEYITPFSNISIIQDIHHHHSFQVVVPIDAFESTTGDILQKSKNYIGKSIFIRFGPKFFDKKHPDNEFVGLITKLSVSRQGNGERMVILSGNSPSILLDGNGQCRTFTEKALGDIANSLLEKIPNSLETHIHPVYKSKIPYVVQYNESNYSFLKRMAARYGEWFFYDGKKLIFGKLPKGKVIDLPFAEDLFNFNFSLQLLPVNGKAIAYNYIDNMAYESLSASATVSDLDDFGKFTLDQSAKTYSQEPVYNPGASIIKQKDLDELLELQKATVARDMILATGDSDNSYLNVGSTINITGETIKEHDYGKFIVTSITHNITGTYSYSNDFTAIPAENQTPPAPQCQKPFGNNQPAVITDNKDPEGLGRVKARFYWQKAPETTPWIRLANTMSGNGKNGVHGFYFVPEKDDEVMIGFEDNNPDKPFVVGSVYHKKVAPSEWKDNENQIKVIRTRNGNQIYLIDKDGKEEIKILNKDVGGPTNIISLTMEGEGKITIETKGQLVMKAKSIEMTAEEGIKIESGKATDIKAQEINASADNAIKMKSQEFKMECTSAKIKASAQLNIEGAQSTIKASMLQIDGGATASVKAGIIQLN